MDGALTPFKSTLVKNTGGGALSTGGPISIFYFPTATLSIAVSETPYMTPVPSPGATPLSTYVNPCSKPSPSTNTPINSFSAWEWSSLWRECGFGK